jgi:uncharacterized Zn-binding protein involved in type VI secretion
MAEKAVARVTDAFAGVCVCHPPAPPIPMGGVVMTGSNNVLSNGLGNARIGDFVIGFCGHFGVISSGSGIVKANEIGNARNGDPVVGCLIGVLVSGSGNVECG